MIHLPKDKPIPEGSEITSTGYRELIEAKYKLINLPEFSTMTYNDCVRFVFRECKGAVNLFNTQTAVKDIFLQRGFIVDNPYF